MENSAKALFGGTCAFGGGSRGCEDADGFWDGGNEEKSSGGERELLETANPHSCGAVVAGGDFWLSGKPQLM